jgi:hypothetical protein
VVKAGSSWSISSMVARRSARMQRIKAVRRVE